MLDINHLEKELGSLPKRYVVVLTGKGKPYNTAKLVVLDNLCNKKKLHGIYVSQKTPAKKMAEAMKKKKFDLKRLFFIDATGKGSTKTKRQGRYLRLNANQISDLAVAIESWVRTQPKGGEKFLFLDEYSALFIYNSFSSVKEFRSFMTDRMKMWGLRHIFISLESSYDLKLLDKIYKISDKVIEARSLGVGWSDH